MSCCRLACPRNKCGCQKTHHHRSSAEGSSCHCKSVYNCQKYVQCERSCPWPCQPVPLICFAQSPIQCCKTYTQSATATFAATSATPVTFPTGTMGDNIIVSFPQVSLWSPNYDAESSTFSAPFSGNFIFSTTVAWTNLNNGPNKAFVSIYTQTNSREVVVATSLLDVSKAGDYLISIPSALLTLTEGTLVCVKFSCLQTAMLNVGSKFAGNSASGRA